MPSRKIFTDTRFEGHELSSTPHSFSCRYMRKVLNLIDTMKDRHSKILQVRMDLRYPHGYYTNNQFYSAA